MGARIKKNIILQNRIIFSTMSTKLYAQCTVNLWKNNTPAPNTHNVCVCVLGGRHFDPLHGSN